MGREGRLFAESHSNQRFIKEHESHYATVGQLKNKPLLNEVKA
jgi:hypothetical protein